MASVMVSNLLPASAFRGPQHEIRGRAVERQKEHIVGSTLLYWEKMRVKCDGDRTDVYERELVLYGLVYFTTCLQLVYWREAICIYGWIIGSGRWWQIYVGTVFYTGLCIYVLYTCEEKYIWICCIGHIFQGFRRVRMEVGLSARGMRIEAEFFLDDCFLRNFKLCSWNSKSIIIEHLKLNCFLQRIFQGFFA